MTIRGDKEHSTRYGGKHQKLRAVWAPKVDAGQVACARCGGWIASKGQRCPRCRKLSCRWDLGHNDQDRSSYTGPEHSCCNRATSTHRAQRQVRKRRQLPGWWPRPT